MKMYEDVEEHVAWLYAQEDAFFLEEVEKVVKEYTTEAKSRIGAGAVRILRKGEKINLRQLQQEINTITADSWLSKGEAEEMARAGLKEKDVIPMFRAAIVASNEVFPDNLFNKQLTLFDAMADSEGLEGVMQLIQQMCTKRYWRNKVYQAVGTVKARMNYSDTYFECMELYCRFLFHRSLNKLFKTWGERYMANMFDSLSVVCGSWAADLQQLAYAEAPALSQQKMPFLGQAIRGALQVVVDHLLPHIECTAAVSAIEGHAIFRDSFIISFSDTECQDAFLHEMGTKRGWEIMDNNTLAVEAVKCQPMGAYDAES